ncbi:MAG TPA: tyrosine-type recombinase/integrase, partial [Phycisphaerae bacterium]|nr:tyrosine-type recombinase/integrase [Phycisphaerae bacterium]
MRPPRLFKKRTSKPVPKDAEVIRYRGRRCARWEGPHETYTVPLNAKGTRIVYESAEWWVGFEDAAGDWQEAKGYTDRTASEALMVQLVKKAERGQIGVADPMGDHRRRPIGEHVAGFRKHLEDRDDTPEHVALTVQRVEAVIAGTGAGTVADLSAGRVAAYLAELRKVGLPKRPESKRKRKALSVASANHYTRAVRAFGRWLVADRRAPENPAEGLSLLKSEAKDRKRRRRALSAEELKRLVEAARKSGRSFRSLSGADRGILYTVAAYTGLRASELASLTPASLDLSDGPTVTCAAAYTKNGQEAVLPLRPDLAAALSAWVGDKAADVPLWPGTWAKKASAKMIRVDLEAAGIEYKDASDRYADFHSLRHTFLSSLARAGVHPKNAQELARHSRIDLTMGVYTHVCREDLAASVAALPDLPTDTDEAEAGILAATGTDDATAWPVRAPVRAR